MIPSSQNLEQFGATRDTGNEISGRLKEGGWGTYLGLFVTCCQDLWVLNCISDLAFARVGRYNVDNLVLMAANAFRVAFVCVHIDLA